MKHTDDIKTIHTKMLMFKEIARQALQSESEKELLNFMTVDNEFVNREIAKNIHSTPKVLMELLDNHSDYTMNLFIALNDNITAEVINKLYHIAGSDDTNGKLKKDLDKIFKGNN